MIAESLKEAVSAPFLAKVEAVKGYLNFISIGRCMPARCSAAPKKRASAMAAMTAARARTICIDYSSINIAKRFHIGHLSTTMIGNALYKLYSFCGYQCVGINHLGDWGTQFGKLIVAYKKMGQQGSSRERRDSGADADLCKVP